MHFSSVLTMAAAASAVVIPRQQNTSVTTGRVLVSGIGYVVVADFDGTQFKVATNNTVAGVPSWMAFKEPDLVYTFDEYTDITSLYKLDAQGKLDLVTNATGSPGVVSLGFNKDKTRLVGASYGNGTVDAWNITNSAELKKITTTQLTDAHGPNPKRQTGNIAHQALLDPTGRFFAITDLGSDHIVIIDSKDDAWTIANSNPVTPAGCGPRHGVFYPARSPKSTESDKPYEATHYMVVCEMLNRVLVFNVDYTDTGLTLTQAQDLSTYGTGQPKNATVAAAGEIVLSDDNKDVYISNRITGFTSDSIAHFKVKQTAAAGASPCSAAVGGIELDFVESVPSSGSNPRMFSLSKDGKVLFAANMAGQTGLLAFNRGTDGKLTPITNSLVPMAQFGTNTEGGPNGPQFVQQIA